MYLDLTVVIVNYNTAELTAGAVRSLVETRGNLSLEIIVVDNASTRGDVHCELAKVQPLLDRDQHRDRVFLKIIDSEKNLGFTGGNNVGLRQAAGSFVLLLNSDTIVQPGCLQKCVEYLRAHPEVGVLGPKLLDPDGQRQLSCRRFPSFKTALFNRYSFMTKLFPSNPWSRDYLMSDPSEAQEARPVDWVSGAALFISRRALDTVGLMDESFFMYAEDVDYCLRVHHHGLDVHYLPQAEIVHLIGESSKHLPLKTILWRHESMWVFYYKHFSRHVAFFDLITFAGIMIRAALKIVTEGISASANKNHREKAGS